MDIRSPRNPAEHREALSRLIDRQGFADPLVEQRVGILEDYARKRGLSLDHCLVLDDRGVMSAVALCLDSPGRTSTILLSPSATLPRLRRHILALLAQSEKSATGRKVQLLQGMVAPECSEESLLYAAAGFRHLATLIYMQADLHQFKGERGVRSLNWETYGPSTHSLFARVIEGTYQDSLDCGSLNGVRDIEDILASHRGTGQFDPQQWRVGLAGSDPVGVILLAYIEEQQAFELVYMGCLPRYRGKGFGASLLAHGMEIVRKRAVWTVCLSVDEKNRPARKLYDSFGFREVTRRDVWIRILAR